MRILITGANGTIGRVLMRCLRKDFEIFGVDKKLARGIKKLDILKQPAKFKKMLNGVDALIHLAWDTRRVINQRHNKTMTRIVLENAAVSRVKRVILASSVHAAFGHIDYHKFRNRHLPHRKRKIKIVDGPWPISSYGEAKVYLERLGKIYCQKRLEVVAIRFGNVTVNNSHGEYPFWLSWRDLCQFIKKCCLVKKIKNPLILFATSNNACNPFDILESRKHLGYKPQDGSFCPLLTK